jgi:anaerobic ribonucleoside-triphosphate reductase
MIMIGDITSNAIIESPQCTICSEFHEENRCDKAPICPKCGNNRQVWVNQITGVITCHRAYCDTEIKGE